MKRRLKLRCAGLQCSRTPGIRLSQDDGNDCDADDAGEDAAVDVAIMLTLSAQPALMVGAPVSFLCLASWYGDIIRMQQFYSLKAIAQTVVEGLVGSSMEHVGVTFGSAQHACASEAKNTGGFLVQCAFQARLECFLIAVP